MDNPKNKNYKAMVAVADATVTKKPVIRPKRVSTLTRVEKTVKYPKK